MDPLLTVIIPTRNRATLARQAIARVLEQSYTNFEVIVMENSDKPELSQAEMSDSRVRVLPSDRILSMPDNWERAIDYASGRYLMVISDKDMLLPCALEAISETIARFDPDLVNYRKSSFWSNGHLQLHACSGRVRIYPTSPILHEWFRAVQHLHNAPMIYNSAVRRELILHVRKIHGRFFFGSAPDVASGAILMASTPTFVQLDRVLSLAFFGAWSIGIATRLGLQGAAASFSKEFSEDPVLAAGLVYGIPGTIAGTLLACKRAFPELFVSYEIDWPNYVENVLSELRDRERQGIETASDRAILRAGAGRIYSRWSLVRGHSQLWLPRNWSWYIWLSRRSRIRFLFPPHPGFWRRARTVRQLISKRFRSASHWLRRLIPGSTHDHESSSSHTQISSNSHTVENCVATIDLCEFLEHCYVPQRYPARDLETAFRIACDCKGITNPA